MCAFVCLCLWLSVFRICNRIIWQFKEHPRFPPRMPKTSGQFLQSLPIAENNHTHSVYYSTPIIAAQYFTHRTLSPNKQIHKPINNMRSRIKYFPGGLFGLSLFLSPCLLHPSPFYSFEKKKGFLLNKWFYMVCKNDLEQKKENGT